jgi:hypothetical protein
MAATRGRATSGENARRGLVVIHSELCCAPGLCACAWNATRTAKPMPDSSMGSTTHGWFPARAATSSSASSCAGEDAKKKPWVRIGMVHPAGLMGEVKR